jgi:hypothetical protein
MKRGSQFLAAISLLLCRASLLLSPVNADELKLKDGSKIIGTVVGFEENSFKVKTNYGYAVVQKDQVATITISDAPPNTTSEKKREPTADWPVTTPKPAKTEAAVTPAPAASASRASTSSETAANSSSPADPAKTTKKETASASAPVASSTPFAASAPTAKSSAPATAPTSSKSVTPSASTAVPANSVSVPAASAPATTSSAASAAPSAAKNAPAEPASKWPNPAAANPTAGATAPAPVAAPQPAKPAVPPPVREEVNGNQYVNETYGFRMYKPPGWDLIAGARAIMPGALAALGTSDEKTYLMIGLAPAGETLTDSIDQAEQRLREAMASFRVTDQKRLVVSGVSSIAHKFRGSVNQHEWSGIVVFVPIGAHIYTIFGMTYAESDLVQIQENVINRAITSLQFSRN